MPTAPGSRIGAATPAAARPFASQLPGPPLPWTEPVSSASPGGKAATVGRGTQPLRSPEVAFRSGQWRGISLRNRRNPARAVASAPSPNTPEGGGNVKAQQRPEGEAAKAESREEVKTFRPMASPRSRPMSARWQPAAVGRGRTPSESVVTAVAATRRGGCAASTTAERAATASPSGITRPRPQRSARRPGRSHGKPRHTVAQQRQADADLAQDVVAG